MSRPGEKERREGEGREGEILLMGQGVYVYWGEGGLVAIGSHWTDLSGDGRQSPCLIEPLHSFLCVPRLQVTLAVKEIHIHVHSCVNASSKNQHFKAPGHFHPPMYLLQNNSY